MGVGVDVGSTTVKVVVGQGGAILHRAYARHHGRCKETATRMLADAAADGPIHVTGSAGSALAEALGGVYVHEVHAVARAVRTRFPDARTVVELGGQDAKMIHFERDGSFASEMNERCAAGTGVTLDRCLHRIGLDVEMLADFAVPDAELPVISAKCGVFAESDVVGLVKSGVPRELVVGGLLDAIVRGNLAVLARGRPLPPGVILLGGPHAYVPALADLWRRHLAERWLERDVAPGSVLVPEHAAYFAAEGALAIEQPVRRLSLVHGGASRNVGPGLVDDERATAPPETIAERRGALALGIDAGSTTIKAVVLDAADRVVHRVYRKSERGPLEDARAVFETLARDLGGTNIASFGVTGYAADVLAPVFGADAAPVETIAHARAALRWVPDADVVCDVGGQDIKVLVLEHGSVRDFRLSHQCAAGNGALLEAAARDLGVPLDSYAGVAFEARRAPELAIGCAVFLDSERVTCQRDGFTPAEILAAFARVLPRNIWENVVAAPIATLGRVFVLSGGVQLNRAALRAQIEYLEAHHPNIRIVVHPHAETAGAIGAAIAGREKRNGATRFVGLARASELRFTARNDVSTRCRACPSACARTVVEGNGARFTTGHGCERGADEGHHAVRTTARNLVRIEARRLFEAAALRPVTSAGIGIRVAIPRVLSMYRSAPLFFAYFRAIGAEIFASEPSSEALFRRSAGRGVVDACFPVKLAHAHLADLVRERNFDVLFYPVLTHAVTAVRGCADSASCPVVAGTPLVAQAAFEDVALLAPTLVLTKPEQFEEALWNAVSPIFPKLGREEHRAAIAIARQAQRDFETKLESDGRAALERARVEGRCAVLLLGRPYHADPGIHHDIGSELWALGRTTLTIRALPKDGPEMDLAGIAPELTNSGDGEKLAASRIVAANRHLVAIEISSFKCGQDAALYGAISDLARTGGKPFLALHDLDETRPVASLRLRLRTFLDAVERWEHA